MSDSRLPCEINYEIISHLSDDEDALASCSLVCRSWRSEAQGIRFRVLKIDIASRDPHKFTYTNPRCDGDFGLAAPIASYVNHLTLESKVNPANAPRVTFLKKIVSFTNAFPSLKTLTLKNIYLRDSCLRDTVENRDLERLSLVDFGADGTPDRTIGTLFSLYNMRDICVTNIQFSNAALPSHTCAPANLANVQSLTVRSHVFTASVVDVFSRGSLRELRLRCSSVNDTRALGSFIASGDSSLEHLRLEFIAKTRPPPDMADLPELLHRCQSLTALTLRVMLAWPTDIVPEALRVVAQLVAGLPTGVQTLTIVVAVDTAANNDPQFRDAFAEGLGEHLAWLDTAGSGPESALAKVCWTWTTPRGQQGVVCPVLRKDLTEIVKAQFPTLGRRGMLFFVRDHRR
ncbi:F-box protein [Phanerochaete sordida]|uniref:F-box protein n=1 Tax=Phanerochaete sordida TaxID=48140 RepID=A0A9P3GLK8_9APHY|nr:F-box protein [Phanerochaete sordida]